MSDEVTIVQQSYQLICKDLGLEENWSFEGQERGFDWLKEELKLAISHLMDADFAKLLNFLYRIDISETKIKQILSCANPDQIAHLLAKAVIDRTKQKVITRLKYSS